MYAAYLVALWGEAATAADGIPRRIWSVAARIRGQDRVRGFGR